MVLRLKNREEYIGNVEGIAAVRDKANGAGCTHRFFPGGKGKQRNCADRKRMLLSVDKQELACMFNGLWVWYRRYGADKRLNIGCSRYKKKHLHDY